MEAREVLPIDCWQSIFNHLDDGGLEAVSLVCKDFLKLSNICKDSLEVVHPKVSMLSKHLKRFKHLKKINLRQFRGDLDEAISEIVRSDTSLNVLGIFYPHSFKASCLKDSDSDSDSKMKNLKALNYKGVRCLCPTDIVLIANSFPNLEQLKFGSHYFYDDNDSSVKSWDRSLTVYAIDFLASKLKFLKKIHISSRSHICDQSLVALSQHCVFLKAVNICRAGHYVTENGIGLLLRNRQNLEALSIAHLEMDSSRSDITIENSISYSKALTSLKFSYMDVSDMLLNAIAKANLPLKVLGLKLCKKFTASGLLMVLSNNLTRLQIARYNFTDADTELLLSRDLDKLTGIEISSIRVTIPMLFLLSAKYPSLVEIRMETARQELNGNTNNIALSENHKIQNLYLGHSRICDESVKKLTLMFPNLRVLDLTMCQNVSSKGIEAILKNCKFIRKLILDYYIEAKLIKDDAEFPEVYLEDLSLSHSEINDEGLAAIATKCVRLVSLNLGYCNEIIVEGLKQIVENITTLKCLHIDAKNRISNRNRNLLEWMLSTSNFASLKKIYGGEFYHYNDEK